MKPQDQRMRGARFFSDLGSFKRHFPAEEPSHIVEGMNGRYLEDGRQSKGLRRKLLYGGVVLLVLFWLAAMPLPGPLSRARERWWQYSTERRAQVESHEAHDQPNDNPYTNSAGSIVIDEKGETASFSLRGVIPDSAACSTGLS
jgi:hypothetical protein